MCPGADYLDPGVALHVHDIGQSGSLALLSLQFLTTNLG